jgi:hypothetical protein
VPGPTAVVPMLVAGLLLASGTPAVAAPRAHRLPAGPSGLPSPAPSAAAQASALAQMTGLSAHQITTRQTCPAQPPGQAQCAARVVVLRSTGALVRPRLHPFQALADVRLGRRRHTVQPAGATAGAADAASTGQSAPAAGTPAWLQQAYDLSYLSATQGANDTIAVIDAFHDPYAAADLATFRSTYGLPACTAASGCFKQVNEYGSSTRLPARNLDWELEESLDLDAVSSLCPNCHIILVEANSDNQDDLSQAMQEGVRLGANQLSDSWSIVYPTPPADRFTWPDVATVAATGDNGYNAYLDTTDGPGDGYPAAAAGVTAAGGTTLAAATTGLRGYGESAWSDAGSGCVPAEPKPAYQTVSGCSGRAYADVSADADPNTGLSIYDSGNGGWVLMGGTSLATPLVAAFDAVTGVAGTTPQWAYTDSALLNDPTSGANGSSSGPGLCAASIFYICNAGVGYDGPTGAGSISGQVASGGPGIGGPTMSNSSGYADDVTSDSASLAGGVYPNGIDTTYSWQYGLTTAYGQQTSATDIGAGAAPVAVSDTLSGLTPATTYHYRLVASNSAGTTYGYDYTLTTASPPADSGDGTTTQSQTTTTDSTLPSPTPSAATPPGTTPTPTTTATTTPTPTATTPPVTSSIKSVATAPAASLSPVAAPAAVIAAAPRLVGPARVGARVRLSGGTYRNGVLAAVRFERCARTCVSTGTTPPARAAAHTVTSADAGDYLRAWVTVTGPGGTVSGWANNEVGPVVSRTAGALTLRPGAATIRGSAGRALARVTTASPRGARARRLARELVRVGTVSGALRVWVCITGRATAMTCTAPRTVRRTANLSLTLRSGQRAELIAVARS